VLPLSDFARRGGRGLVAGGLILLLNALILGLIFITALKMHRAAGKVLVAAQAGVACSTPVSETPPNRFTGALTAAPGPARSTGGQ